MRGPNPKLFLEPRPVAKFGPRLKSLEERFWKNVRKTRGCWLWKGTTNGRLGYGMLYDRDTGRKELAHRVAVKLATGSYPEVPVLHECDTPGCVRYGKGHLFLGTQQDNMTDMAEKGRSCNQHRSATKEEAAEVCRRYRAGESQQKLADDFDFHQTYVSRIVTGRIVKFR